MPKATKRAQVKDTLRFYTEAVKAERRSAIPSLLFPVGMLLRTSLAPYLASMVLASLLQHGEDTTRYFVYLVIISVTGIVLEYAGIYSLMAFQARSQAYLHDMVFSRIMRRGTRYYANNISGKLTSDVTDFVSGMSMLVGNVFINALSFFTVVIIGLILVAINSWQLGLFLFVTIFGVMIWTAINSRARSQMRRERLKAQKQLISHLSDNISNAVTVKTFAREDHEIQQSQRYNEVLTGIRIRDWRKAVTDANLRNGTVVAAQLGMILMLIVLVRRDPNLLAAGIFAFSYTLTISTRIFELNNISRQVEEAFLQAQPMTQMLMEDVEIMDAPNAPALKVTAGAVDLDGVTFAYRDGGQSSSVFKELSLHVKPGERIGLVGPSGGGKSTLTRLLLRFDDIDNGSIRIDEQNIADVTQASLRSAIAYVPQEPLLFHRSIRENIAYGKPEATDEEVLHAAQLAHADEFIDSLPAAYDTVVGERGVKLSGGQRQRIAIARAILKDAPILVLDEATSALDSESEVLIQKALWQLMKARTAIVVAHRLSTIQKMDRIVVLDNGRVLEHGTHKELLEQGGMYARLWAHQSDGFIED